MPNANPQRIAGLRTVITDFLKKRLDDKLENLDADDPKRAELILQFEFTRWIDTAARSCAKIQAATHTIKATHPDAQGTNVFVEPSRLHRQNTVGSHCISEPVPVDIVCDAKLLPVAAFLKLQHDGRTILELAVADDADLCDALSDDKDLAADWMRSFAGTAKRETILASHTLAKQIYWLAGDNADPHEDAGYHLLAPLYASSLAHSVYMRVSQHRFGDGVKEARQARREDVYSEQVLHDYPQLAVQKLGGTKPQNISQLNSERRGKNHLLASLPPVWKSAAVTPVLFSTSMLRRFEHRPEVRRLVKSLLDYLKADPARNVTTRNYREMLVNALIDELLQFAAELRTLPHGWSQAPECKLNAAEKHWLDPKGVVDATLANGLPMPGSSAEHVSREFANWLNAQLRDPLPMGDAEFIHWRDLLLAELESDDWEDRNDS